MAAGAVSLRKSHYIIILIFCNIVKDQANSMLKFRKKCSNYKVTLGICTSNEKMSKKPLLYL